MTYTPSARIRMLEARARERYVAAPPGRKYDHMTEAFFELYADAEPWERQARSYAHALVREPVIVSAEERIQGMIHGKAAGDPFCGYGPEPRWREWNAQYAAQQRVRNEIPELLPYFASTPDGGSRTFIINAEGTPGHIAWRWDVVLRDGLEAILDRHRQAARRHPEKAGRDYYQGVVICLEAILEWNRKHVEALLERARNGGCSADENRALRECADILQQVPARPARTFREALQAYHFMWLCAFYDGPYGGNSPGRFDYLLWPFLKDEYERGAVTDEQATEWVAEVFIKCDEMVYNSDGAVLTIVTGGLTPGLEDAVNPLSRMVIQAISALDITHPAVYNRISRKNPEDYRRQCFDFMLHGGNRAQFLNEEAILHALTRDGRMPACDAAMYICGGCMEINPQGLTSDLFWSFRYNIGKTLELCVTGGDDLVDGSRRLPLASALADHATFESFYLYFESEMETLLQLKFRALDICAQEFARLRPQFVISSMVEDCFEKGRNHMHGGARYADYGGSVIGIPNVANSLMAIKKAVFDEAFVTADELVAALKVDFVGHESLRRRLQRLPKYGDMHPEADALMNRLLHGISRIFDSHTTFYGGRCKQVLLTFLFAPEFGNALGATPEGNKAGTPVAHGLTPANSQAGLSETMQSYLSLDNHLVSGGASTMWDMDAAWINEELLESVYSVFEGGGGQIFQGNMTDVRELEKAFLEPERYPNLIVRVGGFSSRFMNLSPAVRAEIISRRRWS